MRLEKLVDRSGELEEIIYLNDFVEQQPLVLFQAFWHVLFSILLTVIAFLWRPTKNNQKYAFIPLLEGDNDDDDEQDEFVASNYSDTKMRSSKIPSQPHAERNDPEDDELKWVEDNIVSSSILLADSDEELMNTKFEISKMQ